VGRPAGAKAERDLLGARVEVIRKGAPSLWRRAATDGSYESANDPRILVGLGAFSEVIGMRVFWPDGLVESFPAPPLRTYTTLVRGTGKASPPAGEPR
jgi:enediyne biosynthesis protein E4